MGLIYPLAGLLGLEVDVLMARLRRNAAIIGVIGTLVLLGVVFLLIAAYAALSSVWGPIWAAAAFGGGFLLTALVVWLVSRGMAAAQARRVAERRRSSEATTLLTSAAIAAAPLLPTLLRSGLFRNIGLPIAAVAAVMMFMRSGDGHATHND